MDQDMEEMVPMYVRDSRETRKPRYHQRSYSSSMEQSQGRPEDYIVHGYNGDRVVGFYEYCDGHNSYRPDRRRNTFEIRDEVIDLRKPRRDLPSPGQIIWDDIGDSDLVESLSWSQSDVEREIESWDQRLRESETLFRRTIAWDDGDMIQFDDYDETYMPRRASSAGAKYDEARKTPKEGRRKKDQERGSIYKYRGKEGGGGSSRQLLLPQRSSSVGRSSRTPQDHIRQKPETLSFSGTPEVLPMNAKAVRSSAEMLPRSTVDAAISANEGDCPCPCDISYSSLKRDDGLFAPDTATPDMTIYHQQTSTPSSLSPTSGAFYMSSRHWLGIILIVLVGGAVGVALPYALSNDDSGFQQRLQLATAILKQVPLIDGHNDLPWNIRKFLHNRLKDFNFKDDLRRVQPWSKSAWSHTDLPRLKSGLISAQFWAAYVPCEAQFKDAVQLSFEQVDVIRRFTERYRPDLTLCTTSSDIEIAHRKGQLCSLIGVEGGHSMGSSLPVLRALYEVGVRYLTLTSTCNTPWADCSLMDSPGQTGKQNGLSSFGRSVVREMNRLGMVVDLSHVSEATMIAALNVSKAPVIFSHSAAHALCNSSRNVPDHVLRLLAANDGIIMINFYSKFLSCRETATVQDAIAHIEHVRKIAGIDHIGLGAGYDGINITPERLNDVSSYPVLFAELIATGWNEDHLKRLAGLNFLRVLKKVESLRDELQESGITPSEDVIAPRLLSAYSNCTSKNLF